MRVRRGLAIVGFALLALLAAFFLLLPTLLEWGINRELRSIQGYTGHVDQIELRLLHGNFGVTGLRLVKTGRQAGSPFFSTQGIRSHVRYADLLRGRLRASLVIDQPVVRLVEGKTEVETQTGEGVEWMQKARRMFPIRIDRLKINNGEIHLKSQRSKVPVEIKIFNIQAEVKDLTNRDVPATLKVTGDTTGNGHFSATMVIQPLKTQPTFDLTARFNGLELRTFNQVLRAYGGFDVTQGIFELTTEVSVRNGSMKGYVKPFFKDLELLNWEQDVQRQNKNIGQLFWEGVVSLITEIFKNPPEQQVATVIPLEGKLKDPESDFLVIIAEVLQNAFIRALTPAFEGKLPVKK